MQDYFYSLSDYLAGRLEKDETLICTLEGEHSDFVRFNRNRIRQCGHVEQQQYSMRLVIGKKHLNTSIQLSGIEKADRQQASDCLVMLREVIPDLPDDPYLNLPTEIHNSEAIKDNLLPPTSAMTDTIMDAANGLDLVGILANGVIYNGFYNSQGQRNWQSNHSFNFDWSCYLETDKAVKNNYSGDQWSPDKLDRLMLSVKSELDILKKPPVELEPGGYRVYLAPAALNEITDMLRWNGFSLKAHQTRQTPLLKMVTQGRNLSSDVSLIENNANSLAPGFTQEGFIVPEKVELVSNGKYSQTLANARSACEYGQQTNCDYERPYSLEMQAGNISNEDILRELDTGLLINNLWYCNFSDVNNCRITGMTRFACFMVKNGKPVAPVNVMRFDETIYNILGDKLAGITTDREHIIDPGSYDKRSSSSSLLPGILVDDFSLTL